MVGMLKQDTLEIVTGANDDLRVTIMSARVDLEGGCIDRLLLFSECTGIWGGTVSVCIGVWGLGVCGVK